MEREEEFGETAPKRQPITPNQGGSLLQQCLSPQAPGRCGNKRLWIIPYTPLGERQGQVLVIPAGCAGHLWGLEVWGAAGWW